MAKVRSFIQTFTTPSPALVITCLVAAILLALLSIRVRTQHLTILERDVFLVINHFPSWIHPFFFGVMQAGSYVFIFISSSIAALMRRKRLALALLLSGNIAYWLAILVKNLVGRERPGHLIEAVQIRDTLSGTLGYPSGHVSVAVALGFTLARFIPKRFHYLIWIALFVVGVARIYVGAHLPLDVAGGLLVGWLSSNLTQLFIGERRPTSSPAYVQQVCTEKGLTIHTVRRISGDARGSMPYHATTDSGQELFIKATSNEQRDADWLYKVYRRIIYRHAEDEPPFITAKQKSEHEAYMSLVAARAGTRTPYLVNTMTDSEDNAYLIYEFRAGTTIDKLPPGTDLDSLMADAWQQVRKLHAAGAAHRDLRGSNILVHDNRVYFLDFSFAEANASRTQQLRDIASLLVTLAAQTNPQQCVAVAASCIGCSALAESLPYIQKATLSPALRSTITHELSALLATIRNEIMQCCDTPYRKPPRELRISRKMILLVIFLGLAIHFLLPQLGEVRLALHDIAHAHIPWVLAGLLLSGITYILSALVFRAAVLAELPFMQVVLLQLASSFTNRLAPGGIGSLALNVRYLQKRHINTIEATTSISLTRIAGTLGSLLLLPILLLTARNAHLHTKLPSRTAVLLLAGSIILLSIGLLATPRIRREVGTVLQKIHLSLRHFIAGGKALSLLGSSILLTLTYGACLYVCLLAVGAHVNIFHVTLVYIAGSSLGSVAPTPGGLGATEAILVSALLIFTIPTEQAVAGVLVFRLASFWLPMIAGLFAFRWLTKRGYI